MLARTSRVFAETITYNGLISNFQRAAGKINLKGLIFGCTTIVHGTTKYNLVSSAFMK